MTHHIEDDEEDQPETCDDHGRTNCAECKADEEAYGADIQNDAARDLRIMREKAPS